MTFNRETKIEARALDGEKRTVEMAISSELPYERFFGIEILDHSPEAIDMSRMADNRHPLLLGHDWDQQIGVVTSPTIGEDRVLRVMAKFSRSALGSEIMQDVQDEIRSLVSVGYEIQRVIEQTKDAEGRTVERELSGEQFTREMTEKHGADFYRAGVPAARQAGEPPVYRVVRWTPFEASIVPIPADPSVGIGRAAGAAGPVPAVSDQAAGVAAAEKTEETRASAPPIQKEFITMSENIDAEKQEFDRRDAILALGETFEKYVSQRDISDALRSGKSEHAFRELIMEKMQTRHTDTSSLQLDMSASEIKRYSFGRALQAAISGDWRKAGLERECSEAMSKLVGRTAEGFFVPYDIYKRDFNVGTSTEAGNLVPNELRTDLYADYLRNRMVLGQLGVRFLTGLTSDLDLPYKSTASTLATATEIGSAAETNPLIKLNTLTPKRISAYVEASRQAIIQSAMSVESLIRDDLLTGAMVLLEYQAINGAGTGSEMTGLRNVTGIGTVVGGTNGAAPAWSHFVDLESACANANAEPDRFSGYLTNTKVRGKAKQTQMGTYLPWIWENSATPLNGYRAAVTNNVPSNLTKGTSTTVCSATLFGSDWSDAIIGIFGAPDVTVDPYTKADTGQVKITLNTFADMKTRQAANFAKSDDLITG